MISNADWDRSGEPSPSHRRSSLHSPLSLAPFLHNTLYTPRHAHSLVYSLSRSFARSFLRSPARSNTHIRRRARRTLVDYLTRTRARPVTWPPIAKDVCGTAKSVRGGRSVEKERIEARSSGREGARGRDGGGDTGSGIPPGVVGIVAALALPAPKAFDARSFRLVPRSFQVFFHDWLSIAVVAGENSWTGLMKGRFSRHRRCDCDAGINSVLIVVWRNSTEAGSPICLCVRKCGLCGISVHWNVEDAMWRRARLGSDCWRREWREDEVGSRKMSDFLHSE